jgi:hypothetical protein
MELAITGHPDTADHLLDNNHTNQELFPNFVAIASAIRRTSCKVKPSCCLPRPELVRRYAKAMLLPGAAVPDKLNCKPPSPPVRNRGPLCETLLLFHVCKAANL